ncbi:hydroxylamine reductase [Spirulina sp. CCNP1310]|uniref:hydroxylamine reductase n=1 Tax=Spirulina sp. CCNP1310 TaxID=3110249 RepID=UPI002B2004A4|nr:hydroxylamine reductase [Spirulina sp. CCNP1310]MEA5420095.1 hydroxylamine reductase [Spirulina sp. CCNP1310]
MFCEQCEQTASGQGCHQWGACGKSPDVNAVQDLLVHCLRGLSVVAIAARQQQISTQDADLFICDALFATMTNVNFDRKRFVTMMRQAITLREMLKLEVQRRSNRPTVWPEICNYEPDWSESLIEQGFAKSLTMLQKAGNPDIFALQLTVIYGLKGMVSYAFLAAELGQEDPEIYYFCEQTLADLDRSDLQLLDWVNLALKVGELNFRAMELLDRAHTETYGHPVPTPVPLNPRQGQAILVSGHDIKFLAALLEQTKNTGLTVYTHGELLPGHGYPKLKENYPHFYGHYGTAWQNQTKDFAKFPGAIVMTTNCLMPPHDTYDEKIFTVGSVGYPGLIHLPIHGGIPDFGPAIAKALALPGFTVTDPPRSVTTGFAHNAVMTVADTVINAVKAGQIRHFFLVGGCDGAKPDRNYYTELVEKVPDDCIVLTLACGKFRFFDQQLGEIGGLPRLMDVGQCNDAYSAIQIALGLSQALGMEVNELPLSMILSWYEQKAIAVLLTLLHLGIKNIRLGPTLPAFLTPNVFALLSERYNLQGITTPEADLAACLGS